MVQNGTKKLAEDQENTQVESKEEKESSTKRILKKIWNIVFWVVIFGICFVWIFDYIQVKDGKDPKFCVANKTHKYDDGKVEECVGLGYKVYNYDRSSLNIKVQFSPFFVGMKESN